MNPGECCWLPSPVPIHMGQNPLYWVKNLLALRKQSLNLCILLSQSGFRRLKKTDAHTFFSPHRILWATTISKSETPFHLFLHIVLPLFLECSISLCIQAFFFQVSWYNIWIPDFIEVENKFPFGTMKYNRTNNFCCNNEFLPKFPLCIKCITEF